MTAGGAMITGAAGDIGSAIARRLGPYCLFLVDHPSAHESVRRLAEECARNGATVSTTCFDITDRPAIEHALDQCEDVLGGVTSLVNSAGVQGDFSPFTSTHPTRSDT